MTKKKAGKTYEVPIVAASSQGTSSWQTQTPQEVAPPYEYPVVLTPSTAPERRPFRYSSSNPVNGSAHRTDTINLGTLDQDALLVNWNICIACMKSSIGTMVSPNYAYIRIKRGNVTFFLQEVMIAAVDRDANLSGTCQVVCRTGDVIDLLHVLDEDNCINNVFCAVTFQPFR